MESEEEEKTNGVEHNEDMFATASVTVNLFVADIAGKALETEEERELFLALISSFFQSPIIHQQLKDFVRFNMTNEPPTPDLIIPDKRIILP